MSNSELERIEELLRVEKEEARSQLTATSGSPSSSPTSIRLSPEMRDKAKQLAFMRYKKTDLSQLLKDVLIDALKKAGLL